jgi:hypothetical protein
VKRKFMSIETASARFPVGAKVKFFPVAGRPEFEEAEVRSEPWALGHGQVVVSITSRSGGVAVEHLQALS